jgi:hypothetical protein
VFIRNCTKRIMGIQKMDKVTDEKFNKLLTQYKTLSVERLEVEKSICQAYEVTVINGVKTLSAESFKEITELRKRLSCINKEMKKIDNKILKMWITPNPK